MKKTISMILCVMLMLSLVGCGKTQNTNNEVPYVGAPKIVLNGQDYFATDFETLDVLPNTVKYAGKLTDEEKQYADINGDEYYIPEGCDTIEYILVYQECGTRISDTEVDNTQRQWAYVKWTKKTTGNGTPVSGGADMPINSDTVDTEQTQIAINETSVDMDKVKEKYPEFFEIEGEPFKGIEVYVWQMAENSYYCGLMFGTNRNKSDDEIFALQEKALTVDETKALLNDMDVSKDSIFIYAVAQPYSSYLYEIDDDYCNKVSELFDRKFVVMNSES